MSYAVPLRAGMEPFPGYRLRQPLGKGGFAEVWEAEATDGKPVALKFLPCGEGPSTPREIRNIQTVRQLEHPHLVRIHQVWVHLGYIVVAMELAEGSLLDLLEAYQTEFGTPIVPEQVCLYLSQAAEALDFMNTRQHHLDGEVVAILHLDVKPSNMLLFGETIKLADFGLASKTTSNLKHHRKSGTLDYTAPEVFQGRVSEQTDQYALAVSYCQLRGAQMPFNDRIERFDSKYVRPEPDLSMLTEVERPIILRALSPVPQNRWPSCRELISQLARVVC